jgi:hypothetical protein
MPARHHVESAIETSRLRRSGGADGMIDLGTLAGLDLSRRSVGNSASAQAESGEAEAQEREAPEVALRRRRCIMSSRACRPVRVGVEVVQRPALFEGEEQQNGETPMLRNVPAVCPGVARHRRTANQQMADDALSMDMN